MKILAIDSSGLVASVAVLEDDVLLAEYTVNYKKTHSQTLLPMLDAAAQMIELDLNTLDAVCRSRRTRFFHGTAYRLRHGQGTGAGAGEAADFRAYHSGAGI